jgi:hypothetical protein
MSDELHICSTCADYTPVTTGSGHCDLTDSAVFAGGGCSEWRTRSRNVLQTAVVAILIGMGVGAMLAQIWLVTVAGR